MSYQNWRKQKLLFDHCPVCHETKLQRGQTYCSKKCRTDAYNYRKRLQPVLNCLGWLGFITYQYYQGVLLELTMCDEFTPNFVKLAHKVNYPDPNVHISACNAESLWSALEQVYGLEVVSIARWLIDSHKFESMDSPDLFKLGVRVVIEDIPHSFTCPDCGRRFIDTPITKVEWGSTEKKTICYNCDLDKIPF